MTYDAAVRSLEATGRTVVRGGVNGETEAVADEVARRLAELGADVRDLFVDADAFRAYRERAEYAARFPEYYGTSTIEKPLEHFITLQLLGLSEADVFVDIASENSPVPEVFGRLTGAQAYWQDIQYGNGIEGRRIGGDACEMPVPEGFASAAALTCSLEHFERDADMRLCDELGRIVRPGGRVVVAPLYMYTTPAAQTDPVYSAQADVPFDEGVPVYCAEGWRNRHGRYYSPETLKARVLAHLSPNFDCTVLRVRNHDQLGGHVYLRFVLLARRR
jgi:SAM-dependent methyltransferase